MTHEYDFLAVKRAYAELARRAREKDEVRRPDRDTPQRPPVPQPMQAAPQAD